MATVKIDGSMGEGGGQVLRSSLSLSMVTGKALELDNIRANRDKPGLQRQHLTALRAAAAVSGAIVSGDDLGSKKITFHPNRVNPGRYKFDIGTAGSTMLVLQTLLPPLITAGGASEIELIGGTHNPMAPPLEFLLDTFLPLLEKIGPRVDLQLIRYGFYPKGGGRITARIQPVSRLIPIALGERTGDVALQARILVVRLPRSIAERELTTIEKELGRLDQSEIISSTDALSPGNAVCIRAASDGLSETATALGKRGLPAENVARSAAKETRRYLASRASVGEHLADQLLIPMALAGSGSIMTVAPSRHTLTNIDVIRRFLPVEFSTIETGPDLWQVEARTI